MNFFFKLFFLVFITISNLNAEVKIHNINNYKTIQKKIILTEIIKGLNYPWGLTFIDDKNLVVTEKNGELIKINIISKKITKIKHQIKSIRFNGSGQGGLLDVLYNDGYLYFTYSHEFESTNDKKKL